MAVYLFDEKRWYEDKPSEYADFLHLVTQKFVNSAGERNVPTYVWTVNEEEQIRSLLALGVDGIISDYPDRVLGVQARESEYRVTQRR